MMKIVKERMKSLLPIALLVSLNSLAANDVPLSALADKNPVDGQLLPQGIPKVINKDIKQARNYPMQPPLIPHTTRSYQVNKNNNKCLSCHSRQRTEESQAPMVSVTHFMDRDGNFLAEVSPRRYFCNQCHVTQLDVKSPVGNNFVDMYQLMKQKNSRNSTTKE
jgi:cytochrome c-type protein NapB